METRLNRTEALQFLNRLGYGGASGFMADFAFEWVKAAPKRKKGLKGQDKVGAVLHEFKHGTLHSSSGKKVTDRLLQEAGEIASTEGDPISDIHASAEYRQELLKVMVKRIAAEAVSRAKKG